MRPFAILTGLAIGAISAAAWGATVGERHIVGADESAALRDESHRSEVRVTIWYPAQAEATETQVVMGPPGKPYLLAGAVAADADFASDAGRLPVVLLSHGAGGSARVMGWFGIGLARSGMMVVAVDHPGNNSIDAKTLAGDLLWWHRVDDLRAALDAAAADPVIGRHLDRRRIGVAGMSTGGFTALVAAGARVDRTHLIAFCADHPDDSVCVPQQDQPVPVEERQDFLRLPEIAADLAHSGDERTIPGVRAAFVMAPGLIQALAQDSLSRLRKPVMIVLGDADVVAPPGSNGIVAATLLPNAMLITLPGAGHYDFVSECSDAGRAALRGVCDQSVSRPETHRETLLVAEAFFETSLKRRETGVSAVKQSMAGRRTP